MFDFNWIDYLILVVLVFYAYDGYAGGFVDTLLNLAGFIFSFLLGLKFYGLIAGLLMHQFSLSQGFANAIGFFIITFACEIAFGALIRNFLSFDVPIFKKLNKILGILPGILSGAVLISFILILIVSLPVSAPIKHLISSSKVSNLLLSNAQGWEKQINKVFGGAISETINFLTVEPKSNEIVSLNFKTSSIATDPKSEMDMFNLINQKRSRRGIRELVFDNSLRDLGRTHCEDMLKRGYFSHYTPEDFSPFDRMSEAGFIYTAAGENIALSPDTAIAIQGLMNSPGHKANILSVDFGRVGIGVIDGGIYGELFCQEFTN